MHSNVAQGSDLFFRIFFKQLDKMLSPPSINPHLLLSSVIPVHFRETFSLRCHTEGASKTFLFKYKKNVEVIMMTHL